MCGIRTVVLVCGLVAAAAAAQAQTVGVAAGAGFGRLWDDETNLGAGLVVSGGVNAGLGEHVIVGAEVHRLGHSRSLTYFGADGQMLGAIGRGSFVFGGAGSAVRPMVGAGLGVLHSTGTLHTPNPAANVIGPNVPLVDTRWSLTRPMWQAHAGLRIRGSARVTLQPEVRWSSTFGSSNVLDGIEPPLLGVGAAIGVEWRLR